MADRRAPQQRLESSTAGRCAISLFIAAILACVIAVNFPDSRLRQLALKPAGPVLRATGLDQDWRIFAPDPRMRVIRLEARVEFAGGGHATWRPPKGGALVGAYWDYRWRKWVEHLLLDRDAKALWRSASEYIASQVAAPGDRPTRVSLVAFERQLPPPGRAAGAPTPWRQRTFYRAELTPPAR